jgi:hypothetical protein
MAGRDAAIAAALDELIGAATNPLGECDRRSEWQAGGTNRTSQREGQASMIGRPSRDLLGWVVS